MQLVNLGQRNTLERMTCRNWCTQNIGVEHPLLWYVVEPSFTSPLYDSVRSRLFAEHGALYSIVFARTEDATAFKLVFGL
jgi:hypothetical protein